MVLTTDGEILTNNHVVEGASRISVSIPGEGTAVAKVVGVDPSDDIALLQISGMNGLDPVSIGDSSSVAVGDRVTAIGNAYGKGGTPTVVHGSVTAVHRTIRAGDPGSGNSEQLNDVIQISANVVPGDSGGALLDANGNVIGIITAGPSQGGTSIGYAIPIGSAIDIVNQIRAGHGSSTILIGDRGFLGVSVRAAGRADRGPARLERHLRRAGDRRAAGEPGGEGRHHGPGGDPLDRRHPDQLRGGPRGRVAREDARPDGRHHVGRRSGFALRNRDPGRRRPRRLERPLPRERPRTSSPAGWVPITTPVLDPVRRPLKRRRDAPSAKSRRRDPTTTGKTHSRNSSIRP